MLTQEYNKPNDKPTEMNTMTACINKATKEGYTDSFKVKSKEMFSTATEKGYSPDQVKIINFYRFEGESDPADNSIVYVIETSDGTKGVLVDAYGPYSDVNVTKFMTDVEDINKKVTGNNEGQSNITH